MPDARNLIGIDLDNTIIDYDALFVSAARDLGLLPASVVVRDKTRVRNALRARPGGELDWQRLQAEVYGPRIQEARLMAGVETFFERCRATGRDFRIISHKTRRAAADTTGAGTDLHEAARGFLRARDIDPGRAVFEETRAGKLARIRALGCAVFIDDLEEVFAEPEFPPGVDRVLFDPAGAHAVGHHGCVVCRSWEEVTRHVFGA